MRKHSRQLIAILTVIAIEISSIAGWVMPVTAEEITDITDNSAISDDLETDEQVSDLLDDEAVLTDENELLSGEERAVSEADEVEDILSEDASTIVCENDNAKTVMKIDSEGKALPIIDYTYNGIYDEYEYSNKDEDGNYKDILRFCVYVETDLDTDWDGKNDLVQAVIQVPSAAVKGDYKAPTLFRASPYMAGCSNDQKYRFDYNTDPGEFKETDLYKPGTKRTVSYDVVDSFYAADHTDPKEWHYRYEDLQGDNALKDKFYVDDIYDFDYFLIRGFAIVESAGLGANGSEGLETCGSIAERDAFKNIIEWIHGERKAFTDRTNNIPIKAEWANGNVAMEGVSYDGTMAYEVATTGVRGLKTVVPESAISSWYDYTNQQGLCIYYDGVHPEKYDYTTDLSSYCASRFYGNDATADDKLPLYNKLLGYMRKSQKDLKANYYDSSKQNKHWASRDYSKPEGMKASALIVEGLNDYNVNPKQTDLMHKAFVDNNCEVRVMLHQGTHETPSCMDINGYYYHELLNMWYCHYLLDIDNDINNIFPNFWVQSNVDGEFVAYDKWEGEEEMILKSPYSGETYIDPSKDNGYGSDNETVMYPDRKHNGSSTSKRGYYTIDDFFAGLPDNAVGGLGEENDMVTGSGVPETDGGGQYYLAWETEATEDMTISGKCVAYLEMAASSISENLVAAEVMLYDFYDPGFDAYDIKYSKDDDWPYIERRLLEKNGIYMGPGLVNIDKEEYARSPVTKKLITKGAVSLKNPSSRYEPESVVEQSISEGYYYDYSIYTIPTVYTVKKGHRLVLFIMPELDGQKSQSGFWLKNEASYITIPYTRDNKGGSSEDKPVSADPVASKPSGMVKKGTRIMLSCATPGADIFYTTNGKVPAIDANGNPVGTTKKYEDAIVINKNHKIMAFAAIGGYVSSKTVRFDYRIETDWKDIDEEKQKLFDGNINKVPQGMWYCFGDDYYTTKSGAIEYSEEYTGSKITFNNNIHVFYGNELLWENRDYTISYKNNINAEDVSSNKAPKVMIHGKGNYRSNRNFKFNITEQNINNARIASERSVVIKPGTKLNKVKPVIEYNDKKLKINKDYILEFYDGDISSNKIPSDTVSEENKLYLAKIIAKESGNFCGISDELFAVYTLDKSAINLKKAKVKLPKIKYDGKPVSADSIFDGSLSGEAATVTVGGKTLKYGVDFTVESDKPLEAGKNKIILTGLGSDRGGNTWGDKVVFVNVEGTSAKRVKIACLNTSCFYRGRPLSVNDLYRADKTSDYKNVTLYTVVDGKNVALTEGIDYDVKMDNSGAVGKYTLEFELKGAYSGTIRKKINIKPYNIAKDPLDDILIDCPKTEFSKAGAIPKFILYLKDEVLEEGVDYKLLYKNNKKVLAETDKGAPTVVIKGIGNYAGTRSVPFTIYKADPSKIVMTVQDKAYRPNAKKGYFKSKPKFMDGGKVLSVGKGKDIEKLEPSSYKYFYAGTGKEIPDDAVVSANEIIEVRVTVTCSGLSPYTGGEQEFRGYYRLIDGNKNISKAKVSIKTTNSLVFTGGGEIIPIKAEDLKISLKGTELKPSDYEIISIKNNRFLGTASMELRGKGEYGGTKKFTFKIKPRKL